MKYIAATLTIFIAFMAAIFGTNNLMGQNQKASDKASTQGSFIPPGVIMPYAGQNAPAGWVFAYGQQVPTTGTYAKLAAAIGTTYCTADHGGTCTGGNFRIPDLRGRIPGGRDDMGGVASSPRRLQNNIAGLTLGAVGGSESQASNVAVGNHTALALSNHSTINLPGHYHGHGLNITNSGGGVGITGSTATDGPHSHSTNAIRRSDSRYLSSRSDVSVGGSSSAAYWDTSAPAAYSYASNDGSSHSHSGSGLTTNNHTHAVGDFSGTIGLASGSGGCDGNSGSSCSVSPSAHSFSQNISNHSVTNSDVNNLAPTVIVNYIIKY